MINARFHKIKSIECIIQLVNNESEEERIYFARKLQNQIDTQEKKNYDDINSRFEVTYVYNHDQSTSKPSSYKPSRRSEILNHHDQESYLI